ncbi:hypothetical protein R1flu_006371 [Riccia fluitans]|uniref:Uncharacterized protein n=1 Tax=Riccia fluitans TaxID=41844 RepID=A0ABD1YVU5_9MARC
MSEVATALNNPRREILSGRSAETLSSPLSASISLPNWWLARSVYRLGWGKGAFLVAMLNYQRDGPPLDLGTPCIQGHCEIHRSEEGCGGNYPRSRMESLHWVGERSSCLRSEERF